MAPAMVKLLDEVETSRGSKNIKEGGIQRLANRLMRRQGKGGGRTGRGFPRASGRALAVGGTT